MTEVLRSGVSEAAKVRIAKLVLWTAPAMAVMGGADALMHFAENHSNTKALHASQGYSRCFDFLRSHSGVLKLSDLTKQLEDDCGLSVYTYDRKDVQASDLELGPAGKIDTVVINADDIQKAQRETLIEAKSFDTKAVNSIGGLGFVLAELAEIAAAAAISGNITKFNRYVIGPQG